MSIRTSRVMFYGDLNCPFCYAENELLIQIGCERFVDWRGVNHMPDLSVPWGNTPPDDLAMLPEFKERIAARLPDIPLELPPQIPNSLPGTMAVIEATAIDAAKGVALRTALFRALWQRAQDISAPEVVAEACREVGLEPVSPSRAARAQVKMWTVEWDHGKFDRRIPVLATADGQRLLGLGDADRIAQFLLTNDPGEHLPDVCRARGTKTSIPPP